MTTTLHEIPDLCGDYFMALIGGRGCEADAAAIERRLLPMLEMIGATEPHSAFFYGGNLFRVREINGAKHVMVERTS